MKLDTLFQQLDPQSIPPLAQWDPPFCGDMDLVISANGEWIHEGTPIRRPALVDLLSRVLRREADGGYYLVTPAEKLRIGVEDLPLLVTDADRVDAGWIAVTADGDRVPLDATHRLTLVSGPAGDLLPALPIRHGLLARLHRNLFYRWVELAERRGGEIGLWSGGVWQVLGRIDDEAS
ncbi:DUF1285 domain-containing protein [Salinicola corii]|uniref:DUF1285 domain-containing protein n=1 Tax=Salinicola corii TaxID=2606937 RepID=A0A640WFY5_9GAMM|nr:MULTISPECIES: DUF1285 domain-containing protein [Salinicola]KAA0019132.1 DUF1285 domain-containing protein [Salinicola corii]MAM57319.1 hypothetical protein [Salinicola sp.]NRB57946.1 DUF1285 domain-containing protein [Salinicola sp.]